MACVACPRVWCPPCLLVFNMLKGKKTLKIRMSLVFSGWVFKAFPEVNHSDTVMVWTRRLQNHHRLQISRHRLNPAPSPFWKLLLCLPICSHLCILQSLYPAFLGWPPYRPSHPSHLSLLSSACWFFSLRSWRHWCHCWLLFTQIIYFFCYCCFWLSSAIICLVRAISYSDFSDGIISIERILALYFWVT